MSAITTAFVALLAAAQSPPAEQPSVPVFPKRWWHSRKRLDIRPVLWSLRNRPGEWSVGEYRLLHVPSKHEFWIANGRGSYRLYHADCSCSSANRRFSFLQQFLFHSAFRDWQRLTRLDQDDINKQFASHFIPSA